MLFGVSDGAIGYAEAPDGGVYALGYESGKMLQKCFCAGYSMMDKNQFDMSIGEHFGKIKMTLNLCGK